MTGVAWAAAVPAAASPVFLGIALARRRRDVALDELLDWDVHVERGTTVGDVWLRVS